MLDLSKIEKEEVQIDRTSTQKKSKLKSRVKTTTREVPRQPPSFGGHSSRADRLPKIASTGGGNGCGIGSETIFYPNHNGKGDIGSLKKKNSSRQSPFIRTPGVMTFYIWNGVS